MADASRYFPSQTLDIRRILKEAQSRWLRPCEICEILRNYQKFELATEPAIRPQAGSLFLFDKKRVRYFRKDHHSWRKKRDGKAVKEAHEKLKVGSVEVLHCYYAHGEDNDNFQRRSYWMLDKQLEDIVLVHYRDVKEGHNLGISQFPTSVGPVKQLQSSQSSISLGSEQSHSPGIAVQAAYASSSSSVEEREQTFSAGSEGVHSREIPGPSLVHSLTNCVPSGPSLLTNKAIGCLELSQDNISLGLHEPTYTQGTSSSLQPAVHGSKSNTKSYTTQDQGHLVDQHCAAHFFSRGGVEQITLSGKDSLFPEVEGVIQEGSYLVGGKVNDETESLTKLDSFGQWIDKEIVVDCDDSLMASNSGSCWKTLDTGNTAKEVSRLSQHVQFDTNFVGPSLFQEQLFCIIDFAPDWAYPGVASKVLTVGYFIGHKELSDGCKWCCMFGEIEVPAEVLSTSTIRCQIPFHAPGIVHFSVTCGNRLACSEVREFEFRERPSGRPISHHAIIESEKEGNLLIRFSRMLCFGLERKWLHCSVVECDTCRLKTKISRLRSCSWSAPESCEDVLALTNGTLHMVIQNMLKDKLYEWLICKAHEGEKGPHALDAEGQGVIHLAAALGYRWALGPIIAAGVSPNFQDARGRTALHWSSYYGREEVVSELVDLGAAAGAVDDPTPEFPGRQTAATLTSCRGHKGIAAYLGEADLTRRFSCNKNLAQVSWLEGKEGILQDMQPYIETPGTSAHVRGHHQVCKNYKGVVWSVSILEKAVLCWRRKRSGLRDFWAENSNKCAPSISEKNDEYFGVGREQKSVGVGKPPAGVQSILRDPEAWDQYMRLVAKTENSSKLNDQGNGSC